MAEFHSFLWLIFLHTHTDLYIYIYISHFFIQSPVEGHLHCFHILTVVNNAAMNVGVHVSFQISVFVFFRYIPGSGIAGSYGSSFFIFWGTFILFSIVLYQFTIGEGSGIPLQYSCLENPMDGGAWKAAVHGVAEGQIRLSDFTFTFHFHALEKEMATHSSVLAWRIPGTGEPGGLLSMGSQRVTTEVT